ncbi:methylcytosine dioxygenase TET3 [Chanos chanos]|uniref:Methylcytosine dioxygenase TET n=1 Tax=Chanos chanos TaxID=29144 RepID=A0A6J2WSN8_CHACN|nr:methylcytosine dioxygenase TET3 [Chanos chanos]
MHKQRTNPGAPNQDIYEFPSDEEDSRVFLKARAREVVSPLSDYIHKEHENGGLFSLPQFLTQHAVGASAAMQRKKRRRCGACGPCMRKENCGTCGNCLNRKVGHQICKLRKCEELKKKKTAWEENYIEDGIKACSFTQNLAEETVLGVSSVDGPRGRGQMEIGSPDRLEEGVLNQKPTNGHVGDTEAIRGKGENVVTEQQRGIGCLPLAQGWTPGHSKVTTEHQQTGWSGQAAGRMVNDVSMEDVQNLMAFSDSASSLQLSNPPTLQNPTTQLYEKFNQEMSGNRQGEESKFSGWNAEGEHCPPEDLNTLQRALTQARHGHKPPNCDCDGPDCPDYLEWLEKKIKLASDSQDKGPCKMPSAPHVHQQQNPSHPSPLPNGANLSCGPDSCRQRPNAQPLPPIPCSPSVLSIAKERNVSLQTAIAIEALTQLSATFPQTVVPPAEATSTNHPHHQLPSHPQNGTRLVPPSPSPVTSSSSSPMPQSFSSGIFPPQDPVSWEQHRPQAHSQGEASAPHVLSNSTHHSSPYPSSNSPFASPYPSTGSPHPQQWAQASGAGCGTSSSRNPWMMANSESPAHFAHPSPKSSTDPMSELKQLLGDTSGKYTNPVFKLPAPHHNVKDKGGPVGMPHIKQEVDTGEYPGLGRYGTMNGPQQHFADQPLSPGTASIRHSTQAALQQHLHHKRNLFSSPAALTPRQPMAGQNLRKWWPQMIPEGPITIKQEPKEPKKKRNTQSSPLLKHPVGDPSCPLGPPIPKPKQIIIKKTKQKASQPIFLPQNQITIQKLNTSPPVSAPTLPLTTPPLPGMEASPLSSMPLNSPLKVDAGQVGSEQSQESILNSSSVTSTSSNISGSTPHISTSLNIQAPNTQAAKDDLATSDPAGSLESTLQTSPLQPTPSLTGFSSLDPKLEELIRQFDQFEEEFTEPSSSATAPGPQMLGQDQAPAQFEVIESLPNSNSGQARPVSPSTEQPRTSPAAPVINQEPMEQVQEVEKSGGEARENQELSTPSVSQASVQHETNDMAAGQLQYVSQEALLEQQQHRILEDPFTTPCPSPPKRVKIESSGGVTVLSTSACFSTDGEEGTTPIKEGPPSTPSLRGFLESPLRYLDTPTKNLLDTPAKDAQAEFPTCDCVEHILEKDEGPYYNHLGSGPTVASIRELMEERFGEKGEAIRIEKVVFTGREGKSSQGCPIAKWVIRRGSETEKLLCLVRHRAGHHCANAVIIVVILAWEGVPRALGDKLYHELSDILTKYGNPTSRRCGLNEDRTCACQGKDPETCGASFSFGCSWSMYFNGCKYARSKTPRKFRLQGDHPKEEENLRDNFQNLATHVAPLYKRLAPQAYSNQCLNEKVASDCRLGLKEGRPFSGVTACMDFCAHAHKDQHNLYNGCTVVCTLTKEDNRVVGQIPEDEQLHVLPLYKISTTDEFGSEENQQRKMETGAIQVLNSFRREVRKLPEPAKSCRQRRLEAKKAASERKKGLKASIGETPEKIIKTESRLTGSPYPQHGNKVVPKQEVKPTIKKEPINHFPPFNGALGGYQALGNGKVADPYGTNGICPHPGYYARGGLPSNGQPPAPGIINGFHPNLPTLPYGYTPNALLPPDILAYEGHNGTWPKMAAAAAATFDQKPDVQVLQARLAQAYPDHSGQQSANTFNHGYPSKQRALSAPPPSRTPTTPLEQTHRATPIIKQEPMDVPLYKHLPDGQSLSRSSTPSTTPQPDAWPGHKPNGTLTPKPWDSAIRSGNADSPFTPDKQRFHQQHAHQPLHPYPQQQQQQQQQWDSIPTAVTPRASPAPSPSPSLKAAASPHPTTPRHWDSPSPSPQPKAWGMAHAGYSPSPRHSNPGAFPDKMLSSAGESRGSTPLGLQERAWKCGGRSAADSTPSAAPEGRLFPDALQRSDGQTCWDTCKAESEVESQGERDPEDEEVWSDSEHNFLDPNIGGVAVAPAHGSVLIECARRELHATTPLKKPNRCHPSRISLVFYQHKNLSQPCHGLALWEAKMKLLAERARQRQQEAALLGLPQDDIKAYGKKRKWASSAASPGPGQCKDKREGVVTRLAPTQHTTTMVTVSPFAFTQLTGHYSRFL